MSDERRDNLRLMVNDEFMAIEGMLFEYVQNLSRGGIFLRCDDELPLGTEVQLLFTILTDDLATIEGVGRVVHHGHGQRGLGIEFVTLTPESRATINSLCDE